MNGSVQAYANHLIGQQMLLHSCTCLLRTNFCSQNCHSISNSMHSNPSVSHFVIPQSVSLKTWNLRRRLHMVGRDCKEEAQGRKGKTRITANASHQTTEGNQDWMMKKTTDPYSVLGISPDCNDDDIKAAFRSRVKEFHPDVYKGPGNADAITQRLIHAYQLLTNDVERTAYQKTSTDPFDDPECEAEDVFVNELNCIGQGCPYSCVARAPDVFSFAANTGCAQAVSQGKQQGLGKQSMSPRAHVPSITQNSCRVHVVQDGTGQDYAVQLAVGQCPRNCIHWVTPLQRTILEDILEQALQGTMYSTEAVMLEALIARAKYENGRYRPPKQKRRPKGTNQWVDWF